MIEDGRSNGTGAMRVNYPKLMVCQKRVPPEVELQAASLADAFENPVGVMRAFHAAAWTRRPRGRRPVSSSSPHREHVRGGAMLHSPCTVQPQLQERCQVRCDFVC